MERERTAARARQEGILKNGIVWIAAAVVILLVLVPAYRILWADRTQAHTQAECELVADALLKQGINDQETISAWAQTRRQFICSQNAVAAWAYLYGGADEDEIRKIYDDMSSPLEGMAILQQDEYQVLLGEFPREEFDAALRERESVTGKWQYSIDENGQEAEALQGGFLDGTAVMTVENDICYYSSALLTSDTVVISKEPAGSRSAALAQEDLITFMDESMSETDTDTILVRLPDHKVMRVKGDLNLKQGDILESEPDQEGRLKIGDIWYIGGISENGNYRVYALIAESEISSKGILSPLLPSLMFAALFLLTVLYAWFLRIDILRGRVEQERNTKKDGNLFGILMRHVRLMFLLLSACMILLFFLLCSLYVVDDTRIWGSRVLADIEEYFEGDDVNARFLFTSRELYEVSLADAIASLMEEAPERMEETALMDLSLAIDRNLFVLNKDGTVKASSMNSYDFSNLQNPDSEWAVLNSVLEGKADHVGAIIEIGGKSHQCWAVRCRNPEGMLLMIDQYDAPFSLAEYYADYNVPNGFLLFAVDTKTGEILSCSDEGYYGMKADGVGLTPESLEDGYVGDLMLDGRRYFVQTNVNDARASIVAADLVYLAGLHFPVILITIVAGLLMDLLMFALVYLAQKKTWRNLEPLQTSGRSTVRDKGNSALGRQPSDIKETKQQKEQREEKEKEDAESEQNASFYREQGGELKSSQGAVGRWLNLTTPFRTKSADEKFKTILHILFVVLFVAGYLIYDRRSAGGIMGSTAAYLLQRSWHSGINAYAVSYALIMILAIYVAALAIRKIIVLVGKNFGSRGETIARLLGSFVSYAAAIGAIGYSLMFLGVNTMTILASAGIVGLGVSIGAKDLVADILAGIAIVFEGEFRTGDIVEIGGFRGTVEEIGIRTTKVMSMGNVKVFRNSEVSGVINLTQRYSIAQVKVSVSRAVPLETVEKIFRRELPGIRRKIPEAVEDITLSGISELNHSCVILLFQTKCRESDRYMVERTLTREIDLLMERENIGSWGRWNDTAKSGPLPPS